MRSDKSRGLYEALQRSRKGMTRAPDGRAGDTPKAPLQQAFPFKPPETVAPSQQHVPLSADRQEPSAEQTTFLPLLSQNGPKQDDTGIHGRDERPEEHDPTPPSTVRAPENGRPADSAETRSPVIPTGGGGPGGITIGGGRGAPRTDLAGFNNWKPLILALLAVLLGLLVLTTLIVGLVQMFGGESKQDGSNVQPQSAESVEDAANLPPQGALLQNAGSARLERSLMSYDETVPPGDPVGDVPDESGRQYLLPEVSGPLRIAIVSSTRSNLERVQAFMLRQGIPTRIVGGALMTEQTFPSASDGAAVEYLRRIKALDVEYSRETRGQTSFATAYFIRQ